MILVVLSILSFVACDSYKLPVILPTTSTTNKKTETTPIVSAATTPIKSSTYILNKKSVKNTIAIMLDNIYGDDSKKSTFQFIDTKEYFGYQGPEIPNGDIGYYRYDLELLGISTDGEYYIISLREKHMIDGNLDHYITGNTYAINKNNTEIIYNLLYDEEDCFVGFNDDFPDSIGLDKVQWSE
jgi:hypothetical protein